MDVISLHIVQKKKHSRRPIRHLSLGTLGTANVSRTTTLWMLRHFRRHVPQSESSNILCPTRHGGCEVVMNKVQRVNMLGEKSFGRKLHEK